MLPSNPSRFILKAEQGNDSEFIVMSRSDSSTILSTMDSESSIEWKRLYRGSEHEFSAAAFHRLCNNQGPTIVLVKAENGRVAAAYSCVSWKSEHEYHAEANPRGFICAIDASNNFAERINSVTRGKSIYQSSYSGPLFYGGFDIDEERTLLFSRDLFGSQQTTVVEYEVFGIEFVV
jgi:hypothetical protein